MTVAVSPLAHTDGVSFRELLAVTVLATVATVGTYVVSIPRWVATVWRER